MALDGKFIDLLVKGLSVVAGHNKNIGKVIDLLGNSLDKLQTTSVDSGNVGKAAKAARVLKDDVAEVKSVLQAAGPKKASKIPLAAKATLIKLRLKTITDPAKRVALKKQLKAVKKVLALKRALKNADPEQKAAIKAKLAKAKAVLKKANKRVALVAPKKSIAKKIALIKAKLAKAKNPARRAALKAQLKAAKKVRALKKALRNADPAEKKAIRAKLVKAQKKLARAAVKAFKAPKAISIKIALIKKALKNAATPKRIAALKK